MNKQRRCPGTGAAEAQDAERQDVPPAHRPFLRLLREMLANGDDPVD